MKKFNVTVNGNAYEVEVEEIGAAAVPAAPVAPVASVEAEPAAAPAAAPAAPAAGATDITCPMPATIVDVKVSVGSVVKKGDLLVVFEAMKMENEILAANDGTVAAVCVNKGDTVESGRVRLSMN